MQTLALLHDSLRLLLARKLFWITLALTALFILAYGSIGFNERGLSIFFGAFTFESDMFVAGSPMSEVLILGMYTNFIAPIWLSWAATILGLISTTSVFPDFLSAGSVDLVLSKPISRIKIFLVKYAGGLLFMVLQVTLLCVGVFLVVGLRTGAWVPEVLLGIPVVTALFSYLFCFNVLIGVMTRSSIAALMLTGLFWVALFGVQTTSQVLQQFRISADVRVERAQAQYELAKERQERQRNPGSLMEGVRAAAQNPDYLERRVAETAEEVERRTESRNAMEKWERAIGAVKNVLPNTQETIALLERWTTEDAENSLTGIMNRQMGVEVREDGPPPPRRSDEDPDDDPAPPPDAPGGMAAMMDPAMQQEIASRQLEEIRDRPAWRVFAASFGFEAVALAAACIIFIRRDF